MSASASSPDGGVPVPFDACNPSGTFVFVSYAHADKRLAYQELERIRSFGVRVWYDGGIEPATQWPDAIANALKRAAAFVVLITPAAVASRNVLNEISRALAWRKPFFAIHLARTELPLGLELGMGDLQAVMRWQQDKGSYAGTLRKALAPYVDAGTPAYLSGHLVHDLRGHTGAVRGVAFRPYGEHLQLLATCSSDGTARLWNSDTGELLETLTGHMDDGVEDLAFRDDGLLLATAIGRAVQVWDAYGFEHRRTLYGAGRVTRVAFIPDGQLVATAHGHGPVRLWDTDTGKQLSTLPADMDDDMDDVEDFAFSPEGGLLATASDRTVWLRDPDTGGELRTLTGHTGRVRGMAFSPDESLLATASDDNTARLWDPDTGEELCTLTGHSGRVRSVVFSPDGCLIATASDDKTARLWNPNTGKQLCTLTGHADCVVGVAFSPDGRLLATASDDSTARLWEFSDW